MVTADETHLNSIFSNFVPIPKDALEEQDVEGKTISATVERADEGGLKRLTIRVEDNGTGLGLGIVKRLV
jgi:nitrogen fixation/metabolism regulation signal transduction histidine kinase